MYEVCNSRLACSNQVGPDIETITEPLMENEFNDIINKINLSFIRMEYNEGFNYVIMSAITFNVSINNKIFYFLLFIKFQFYFNFSQFLELK